MTYDRYDRSGNVTYDGTNFYAYDAEGRVCAVQPLSGSGAFGYLYDAEGNRVAKGSISPSPNPATTPPSCDTSSNGFTVTETYILGPGGEELTMLDGSGHWQRTNVTAGGKQIATYDSPNPDSADPIVALHFEITDPLGTRRVQTDSIGWPEEQFTNWPFGDQLGTTAPANPPPSGVEDATPLHFTGKERDSESGNDYFKYRYYASTMGRWLSPDPSRLTYADLENPQSLNLYNYVGNNPLTRADLDGLCWRGFQWACNLWNRFQNLAEGNGFHTDAHLDSHPSRHMQRQRQDSYARETGLLGQLSDAKKKGCTDTGFIGLTVGYNLDLGAKVGGHGQASSSQGSMSLLFYYDNSNPSSPGNLEGMAVTGSEAHVSAHGDSDFPSQSGDSVVGAYGGGGGGLTWGSNHGSYSDGLSETGSLNTPFLSGSHSESVTGTQSSVTLGPGGIGSASDVTSTGHVFFATGPCQ